MFSFTFLVLMALATIIITSSHAQQTPLAADRWDDCKPNDAKAFCLGMERQQIDLRTPSDPGSCFINKRCAYYMVIERTSTNAQFTLYLSSLDNVAHNQVKLHFQVFFSKKSPRYDVGTIKKSRPRNELLLEGQVYNGTATNDCMMVASDSSVISLCIGTNPTVQLGPSMGPTSTNKYSIFAWTLPNVITFTDAGTNIDYSVDLTKDSVFLYLRGSSNSHTNITHDVTDQRARSLAAVVIPESKTTLAPTNTTTTTPSTVNPGPSGNSTGDPTNEPGSTKEPPKKDSTLVIIIIVVVLFLILAGLAAAYWFLIKNKKRKRPDGFVRSDGTVAKDGTQIDGDMRSAFDHGVSEVTSESPRDKELLSNIH